MIRRRRTKEQIRLLEAQIIGVLQEDHPQSIRHVFYRMTDPRLAEPVQKSEKGYRQVQSRITDLRRAGRLPYHWITDATRRGYHTVTYSDAGDFLSHVQGLYRADLWAMSDHYAEVWCESRSIAGVIEADCKELAVSLYPAGGFTSITLVHQAAGYIQDAVRHSDKRDAHVFYIGDYDPAGVLIDQSIESELRTHLHGVELHFHRIAVNPSQIHQYDLPTKPRKASDKRRQDVRSTVEAEAMPASILRSILRRRVETLLPEQALNAVRVAEESERKGLEILAGTITRDGLTTVVDKLAGGAHV